jgi:hypothetical protein
MTDAGGVDHTHTAIPFWTAFLRIERETGRTLDGAVGLGSEVFTRNTSHARDRPHRRPIGNGCLNCTHWE